MYWPTLSNTSEKTTVVFKQNFILQALGKHSLTTNCCVRDTFSKVSPIWCASQLDQVGKKTTFARTRWFPLPWHSQSPYKFHDLLIFHRNWGLKCSSTKLLHLRFASFHQKIPGIPKIHVLYFIKSPYLSILMFTLCKKHYHWHFSPSQPKLLKGHPKQTSTTCCPSFGSWMFQAALQL